MLLRLGIFCLIVSALSFPFFYPYWVVRREMGFIRSDLFTADLTSYLASGPLNRLYGRITAPFLKPEGELFPGLTALFLAYLGLKGAKSAITDSTKTLPLKRWTRRLNGLIHLLILVCFFLAVVVVLTGGWAGTVWGIPVSAKSPKGFIFLIFLGYVLRFAYDQNFRKRVRGKCQGPDDPILRYYFGMGIGAFLFSLGPDIQLFGREVFPWGPYDLLRRFFPGFDGLRVSSRFFVFFLLSLALFASLGFAALQKGKGLLGKKPVFFLIPILIFLEYFSAPIPVIPVPTKKGIPPVYDWLKRQPDEGAVVELPLPKPWIEMARTEAPRAYFSIFHGKKLFNGYSGYFPPLYLEMLDRLAEGFSEERILDFQQLGIKYLLIHEELCPPEDRGLTERLRRHPALKWKVAFDGDHVFEILPQPLKEEEKTFRGVKIPEKGLRAICAVNNPQAQALTDGRKETFWGTIRDQKAGDFVVLDLGFPQPVSGIVIRAPHRWRHYPRAFLLEGSRDGKNWFELRREVQFRPSIKAFLSPADFSYAMSVKPGLTRWLRWTALRSYPTEWAIGEIEVYTPYQRADRPSPVSLSGKGGEVTTRKDLLKVLWV